MCRRARRRKTSSRTSTTRSKRCQPPNVGNVTRACMVCIHACMSRPQRVSPGGPPFHVLNRAVGRRTVFQSAADDAEFIAVVAEALRTRPMRMCGYCVMPNHWHLVLWPEHDGDPSAFVQHVPSLHVKRWKQAHQEIGYGHLHQGRFKSFPIQTDDCFQAVIRSVERNPLRANVVARAEDWPWSSLGQASPDAPIPPARWPTPQPSCRHGEQWIERVNRPQTERGLHAVRTCAKRGRPFGHDVWVRQVAVNLGLGATL